jgi:hypothetical protein
MKVLVTVLCVLATAAAAGCRLFWDDNPLTYVHQKGGPKEIGAWLDSRDRRAKEVRDGLLALSTYIGGTTDGRADTAVASVDVVFSRLESRGYGRISEDERVELLKVALYSLSVAGVPQAIEASGERFLFWRLRHRLEHPELLEYWEKLAEAQDGDRAEPSAVRSR